MKSIKTLALLLTLLVAGPLNAQEMNKKTKTVETSREVDLPAAALWKVLGQDYGAIAFSHPTIIRSEYTPGTIKGSLGAERMCYFNDKETKMLREKIVKWDSENMTFTQRIIEARKFPIDKENSLATYSVEDLGNGKSRLVAKLEYRTKPGFMSGMVKGSFKKLLDDYFIAIEHYARTNEKVTRENFKSIKKQYTKP